LDEKALSISTESTAFSTRDTAGEVSQENVKRIRAGFEAFNRTGEIVVEHLASDFELHQASSIVDTAGVFRGPDAFQDMLQELQGAFEELSFEAEEFIEAPGGDIVVFIHARGRGRGSGVEIDNHIAQVWTFRDDKAVRMVAYEERAQALEAVGLEK
jgi:ketosteroid isomerase-like protein